MAIVPSEIDSTKNSEKLSPGSWILVADANEDRFAKSTGPTTPV